MNLAKLWRQLARKWLFLKLDYRDWIEDRKRQWRQYKCEHLFRPVRYDGNPGRWCSLCDKEEPLTPEQFFAEFGERGWRK